MTNNSFFLALLLLSLSAISAFLSQSTVRQSHVKITLNMNDEKYQDSEVQQSSRRFFFSQVATIGAFALAQPPAAYATMMRSDTEEANVFKAGEAIGVTEAKKRFVLARKDLQYLLDNYDEISKGGGDAVRRYLGTVGVTSYMYGIGKVLKELREEAEDLVEYTEQMNEFNAYLNQAETSAYSSLFVEHSSAKGTPESFLATSRGDAKMMLKYMDEMATQLQL